MTSSDSWKVSSPQRPDGSPKYILALDEGTTSCRAILFDHESRVVSVAQKEFTQYFPQPGWVEHDAEEIWEKQIGVAAEAVRQAGIGPEDIAAIGITNQRETVVVWDRETGRPVCHAIVWQCRRTAEDCSRLEAIPGMKEKIRSKTGLVIDPYFSGTKLRWILEHTEGVRERAERGELLFGTVETWLIWKLTGGRVHATDPSNASRTMLYNIHEQCWDQEILDLLQIPACMLPEVRSNSEIFGETEASFFGAPVRIAGAAGDQQAALFGQNCFAPGDVKNTYGTGCFLLLNTGSEAVDSESGLVTTIAWKIGGQICYALEGSVFVGGASIQWLRDELGLIRNAAESEELARQVPDTAGCCVVPAFTGLGAPWWDPYARGAILGLTRGVNRCHIVRATLDSVAYQVDDILEAMRKDTGLEIGTLRVDGGASANNYLMQTQADISNVEALRPVCVETTALGAAYLAGLAVGFWKDTEEISRSAQIDAGFRPQIPEEQRRNMRKEWHKAVERARGWAEPAL